MLTANMTENNIPHFPTSAASKTTSMPQNLAKNAGISSALAIYREYSLAENRKENAQSDLLSI